MTRILLAVGCDSYVHMNALSGAERDAKDVFHTLAQASVGDYSIEQSVVLLSPTLNELRTKIQECLLEAGSIDTFTFFFAGHGGVKAGGYYICVRDSHPNMLSTTALGLKDLFAVINESRPRQSNIILDACQAGGVVTDLHSLLKPELIGDADTPGINIFSSSAADQYSGETGSGGIGTVALLKVIRGEITVQTIRPTLDLLEIARAACSLIQSEHPDQTPVYWGFNLYGEGRFCWNPHYKRPTETHLGIPSIPYLSAGSAKHDAIRAAADAIWREYFSVDDDFDPRRFLSRLTPVLEDTSGSRADVSDFIRGISGTFGERAQKATDVFRPPETTAACAAALLRYSGSSVEIDRTILELAALVSRQVIDALGETLDLMRQRKSTIVSSGFGDLFYLPLRISKLLGWAGALHHLSCFVGDGSIYVAKLVSDLVESIIEVYSGSLVSMSDAQAPYLLLFFDCCRHRGLSNQGETVAGMVFNSFVSAHGRIASPDIDLERVPEYLERRHLGQFQDAYDLMAQPTETLSVLLMAASLFNNQEAYDLHLREIDHLSLNIYIPTDHRAFAERHIEGGVNNTFQIGHGIWRVSDLMSEWGRSCMAQLSTDAALASPAVKAGAVLASLIFPDRTPWFTLNTV